MKRARSRLGLLLVLGMLTALLPLGAVAPASAAPQDLVITGVVDGPLTGGIPKAVELYAVNDIPDLSVFGLESANNGGGNVAPELDFPAVSVPAGTYIYVASEDVAFGSFFGFAPTYVDDVANINGDDAIVLYESGIVTDVFGDVNLDGTGTAWDYLDGWAYRVSETGPDGSAFEIANWTFSGVNALDGETTNAAAATPFPIGTYVADIAAPTDPTGTGTATPAAVDPGESTTLEVTVVPGTNPDSTAITVTANLTEIGGSATQSLADTGGNVFSFTATVAADTTPGAVSLPVVIADGEGRSGSTSIALTVTDPTPPPDELLLTQYVEGSSYNKAIEIANIGTTDVDLSNYTLELYSNGANSPNGSATLSGTLAAGDVYVMANTGAAAAILAVADDTNNSVINWNGDDAIVLRNAAGVVDSIGQVGYDPGSEWGDATVGTQNDTICRLDTVTVGDTDPTDVFDPSVEWSSIGNDNFDGLGNLGCEPLPLLTQYVEGSSYNKAIEIGNVGTGDIDLSEFTLELYSNGSLTPSQSTTLSGVLTSGDVYVLAHPSANADILGVADATDGSVINWNGDDAIVLRNAAGVVDSIGQVGFDPGSAWTGTGVSTANDTMCRLDTVVLGDTDPSDVFDPSLEWAGIGQDVLWGLGEIGCEPPVAVITLIHEIQGDGAATPMPGATVTIEGIVVGDFQDGLGGYFVQEEKAEDIDDNPLTSEGIFVYDPTNVLDVSVGDIVRLTGTVSEYVTSGGASSQTQIGYIGDVSILSSGNALPTAVEIMLPYNDVSELEAYEGMYVAFGVSQNLYIAEYYNYDRFGEMVITNDPRPAQPTAVFEPGSTAAAELADLNARSRVTLDDGRGNQNPFPVRHPDGSEFSATNYFRGGDQLNNVVGGLGESFGTYRIQPTAGATYTSLNPRTAAPDAVGGTLTVASFNVLNYFTTLDNGVDDICGPAENLECRGADTPEELVRQQTKIVEALTAIDADIVGLIEIENHIATTVDEPLDTLVAALNDVVGAGTYDYVHTGSIGTDAIKVALIFKTASVTPSGAYAILDSSVDPLFDDDRNRPALAQTFTENGTDNEVTVVVNHLKSKGSACGAGDDDPEQGNCNVTRTNAATALVNWLAGFEGNILVIGDLNSYDKEDPIDVFTAGGYSDLALSFVGEDAYSYVFSGQWGYLDYALANPAIQPFVTGTTIWHINSDEADLLDYDTSYNNPAFYAPDAYRSSDHDPVIVGLNLTPPDTTAPEVTAEFDKLLVGFTTGLFKVDFSCVDDVDPDPSCVGDINGISVEDGQKVFLIKSRFGRSWHRQIGSILYIKDSSFTLTVTGTDESGNAATVTAEPKFRTWRGRHWHW